MLQAPTRFVEPCFIWSFLTETPTKFVFHINLTLPYVFTRWKQQDKNIFTAHWNLTNLWYSTQPYKSEAKTYWIWVPPSCAFDIIWSQRLRSRDRGQCRTLNFSPIDGPELIMRQAELSVMMFQGAIEMFWLHFWGSCHSVHLYILWVEMVSWTILNRIQLWIKLNRCLQSTFSCLFLRKHFIFVKLK